MNTKVRLLFVAAAALSLAACVHRPRHPHGGPPGQRHVEPVRVTPVRAQPARVVEPVRADPAPDSHDCHDGCDHHWDGVRFVVVVGHRHGHGCGHERHGNRWVVAKVVVKPGNDGNGNGRGNGRGRR